MLVSPSNIEKGKKYRGMVFRLPVQYYRAKTKYGRYIRLGNTIIADGPGGKRFYFAYDPVTFEAISELDINEAMTPEGKLVRVPFSCVACHEKK